MRLKWSGHVEKRDGKYVGEEDAGDGPSREEEEIQTKEEDYGCREGGHAGYSLHKTVLCYIRNA